MTDKRTTVMEWWNQISSSNKQEFFINYINSYVFSPAENWTQLTGREIELIYDRNFNPPQVDQRIDYPEVSTAQLN